jgi:[1-hydroxy-2-(trimethylamino)ethyl]phosphonate dioxygenase
MKTLTFDTVVELLRHRAGGLYSGEAITQLQHALQCAALAQADGAAPELVTAALLHDICHLSDDANDRLSPHDRLAAELLSELFSPAVTEPIRMHVDAKRYLCTIEPPYWSTLSDMSKRSLEWQGGPFTSGEALAFIDQLYAEDAVRLRRWDDAAKVPGRATPPLEDFIAMMRSLIAERSQIA